MPTLSHIHVTVADLERTMEFYGKKLGLKARKLGEKMAAVSLGDSSLAIDVADQKDLEVVRSQAKHVTVAIGVADVDMFYEEIRSKGVETIDTPTDRPWSARNFYLRDPDGYQIEIIKE